MFIFKPVSPRIAAIRERYRDNVPIADTERVRIVTEYYMAHESENPLLKRANCLKAICEKMTVRVEDDELLCGNLSKTFRGSALYPEYGIKWLVDEIASGGFDKRTLQEQKYIMSAEDREYLASVADFWAKRDNSAHMSALLPDGFASVDFSNVTTYTSRNPCNRPVGHFSANYSKVLNKGFGAIGSEARENMKKYEGKIFGDDAYKYFFYKSVSIVSDAAIGFAKRYGALCLEKAETAKPERRAELLKMAVGFENIMGKPARTFWEALQATLLYEFMMAHDGQLHGLTLGRLDQYTWPFLKADLERGEIDMDFAQELMDSFYLKLAQCLKLSGNSSAGKSSGGYTSGQHMTIGGQLADGCDATNPVSFLMLQSPGRLYLHDPPIDVRIHENTPPELWEAAIECGKRVGGVPTLQNDGVIIPALMDMGLSLEDARGYCIIGCVEPAGAGNHFPASASSGAAGFFNSINCLNVALNDGLDPKSGRQVGLHTGRLRDMNDFEEVKRAYITQNNYFIDWHVTMTNIYEFMASEVVPLPLVSATMDGCMEKGLDVTRGGAKYNSTGMEAIGCGNVADALSAIKYLVFDTGKYTPSEFYDAWMSNWESRPDIELELNNSVPHWGNDNPYVDELGRWAMDVFSDKVKSCQGPRGGYWPGLWPVFVNVAFGFSTFASPDGRKTGMALADGVSPRQGQDKLGPTAILKSVGRINHRNNPNGTLLNMKLHPSVFSGEGANDRLVSLFQTYFSMGGMQVQYNVVSNETLREAQREPASHRDLVIRIAGFSAYFVELYKEMQDDLIRRNELEI